MQRSSALHWQQHDTIGFPFLAWAELPWVLLCGPLLLLPGQWAPLAWHPYLISSLFFLWFLQMVVSGLTLQPRGVHGAMALLLACLAMSIWLAADRQVAWEIGGYIAFGMALFLACLSWPPFREKPFLLLIGLIGAGLGGTLLGISALHATIQSWLLTLLPPVNHAAALNLLAATERLSGTVNINIFASISAVLLPIYLAFALHGRLDRIGWLLPVAVSGWVGTLVLLLTADSRGSLAAGAVACMVVLCLRWTRLLYGLVLSPLLLVALFSAVGASTLSLYLQQGLTMATLSGRQEIWYRALLGLDDFTFTGIGLGMFGSVIPLLYPYDLLQNVNFPHAHNLYLQVGLDLGLLGLLAYGWLWWQSIVGLLKVRMQARTPRRRTFALAALGSVSALLANGLIDIALWGTKLAFLPWLLLAFALQLTMKYHQSKRKGVA